MQKWHRNSTNIFLWKYRNERKNRDKLLVGHVWYARKKYIKNSNICTTAIRSIQISIFSLRQFHVSIHVKLTLNPHIKTMTFLLANKNENMPWNIKMENSHNQSNVHPCAYKTSFITAIKSKVNRRNGANGRIEKYTSKPINW